MNNKVLSKTQYTELCYQIFDIWYKNSPERLIQHQFDSFNKFIDNLVPEIINGFNPICVYHMYSREINEYIYEIQIKISNPKFLQPKISNNDGTQEINLPNISRLRRFTYDCALVCDIYVDYMQYDMTLQKRVPIQQRKIEKVDFGKIPIVVKSKLCNLNNTNIKDYNECAYDHGGYFIISGNEKVVISNDRICENIPFVFKEKTNGNLVCEVRSTNQESYCPPKLFKLTLSQQENQHGLYIRCMVQNINKENYSIPLFTLFRQLGIQSDKDIIKMCAYDIEDNSQITSMLLGSFYDGNQHLTQAQTTEYLSKKIYITNNSTNSQNNEYGRQSEYQKKQLIQIINNELLPHIGITHEDDFNKAVYIGHMTNKLIKTHLQLMDQDDRDSYKNKRIDTCGNQMGLQFRLSYGNVIKNLKVNIKKAFKDQNMNQEVVEKLLLNGTLMQNQTYTSKYINTIDKNNITKFIKPTSIEQNIKYALSTGTWVKKSNQNCKKGVAQILNRHNYICTVSYLRRINTSMEKNDKIIEPRKIHSTSYGVICANETPESDQTGLMKQLSMGAVISNKTSHQMALKIIRTQSIIQLEKITINNINQFLKRVKLSINGNFEGYIIGNPEEIYKQYRNLLNLKRSMNFEIYTCISFDFLNKTIIVNTEAGRLLKMVYIAENMQKGINNDFYNKIQNGEVMFNDLLYSHQYDTSLIEFIDVQHMANTMIAMDYNDFLKHTNKFDYLELNQCLALGSTSCLMPFSQHNQSPRNCYFTSMAKQAIGVYSTTHQERFDSSQQYVLNTCQKPLITTRLAKHVFQDRMYMGQNISFAVCTYTGFNQEDSVIVNKASIERGLFNNTLYKSFKEVNIKNNSTCETEIIQKIVPDPKKPKPFDYAKLGEDGTVPEDVFVDKDTVIIGKVMPQQNKKESEYRDTSYILKGNDKGYIDRMACNDKYFNNENQDGFKSIKFRLRLSIQPQIGDKLASMGAQKGTIGIILPEYDMPFSKEGVIPDVIMNPHAIPSRMTIAQLLEVLFGHVCASVGSQGYANTFDSLSQKELEDILIKLGLNCQGEQVFYNGMSGEQIRCSIFSGPVYYQRLKHLAQNKIHSRAAMGPITQLLRQPSEGRQRNGGLRLGYMEQDALIAYGLFSFQVEKMLYCSDNFYVSICNKCQKFSIHNVYQLEPRKKQYYFTCQDKMCRNRTDFSIAYMPYSFKQLCQELEQTGIDIKLITQ